MPRTRINWASAARASVKVSAFIWHGEINIYGKVESNN